MEVLSIGQRRRQRGGAATEGWQRIALGRRHPRLGRSGVGGKKTKKKV